MNANQILEKLVIDVGWFSKCLLDIGFKLALLFAAIKYIFNH